MTHPERLGSPGGGSASTVSEPPVMNGNGGESLAGFAKRHGLTRSAARPALRKYIAEVWQRRTFIWQFATSKSVSMYTSSRLGKLWEGGPTPPETGGFYFFFWGAVRGDPGGN